MFYYSERKEKRMRRLDRLNLEKKKEKRMRGDRINYVLPDDLMVEILRYLELEQDREAFSLVCKRWLNLERLTRKTICIRFTDGTNRFLKLLTQRCANVPNVSIDEFPMGSTAPKRKSIPIRVGTRLVNRFAHINGFSFSFNRSEENEMRKYCLSDFGLAVVGEGFTKLEFLKLKCCSNITDVGLVSMAEKCKLLKSLDLESCFVGDESLAAIGKYCTRLEALNLVLCDRLTDVGLVQFAVHCGRTLTSLGICKCRGLTDVSLEAVGFHCTSLGTLLIVSESIHDKGLLRIAKGCSLLKSLNIECENITDEALQAVGSFCLSLELLELHGCLKLTDKSLYAIGKGCKKLKSLTIDECNSLSELGLNSIAIGCAELIRLAVDSSFNIGTTGLISIRNLACSHLSELVLKNMRLQQLDNDALREIGIGCKHLQSLHLIRCLGIREGTLHAITSGCRNLKKLYIESCHKVRYTEMICIGKNCKFLTDLNLHSCSWVGDVAITAIAGAFPQLSCLTLRGLENVGDTGMEALSRRCPLLKDLGISNCRRITDVGLSHIAKKCKLLESCSMMSCPAITTVGVTNIVMGCRNLKRIEVEDWKIVHLEIECMWNSRI